MKFQTSKRIMCCLMAALLLFTFTVRPVTVSATGFETAAMAGFVGIAPEVAIPAILVLLGVAYLGANWVTICEVAEDAVDGLCEIIEDATMLPGYTYNDQVYVQQEVVDTVANAIDEYYQMTYADAWKLGKNLKEMCTIETTDKNYYLVVWSNTALKGTTEQIRVAPPCVIYESYKGQPNVYDGTIVTDDYVVWNLQTGSISSTHVSSSATLAEPTYGTVITIDETDRNVNAIPIAGTGSIEYVDTDTEVVVITDTETGTVPGTTSIDLSGVISWLKSIWQAISELAAQITSPIVEVINSVLTSITSATIAITKNLGNLIVSVRTAINTGITTITDTITTTIDAIIEWLISIGASLADILEWIKTLPGTIVDGISTVLTDIFVPAEDYVTTKVEALRAKFNWIDPILGFGDLILAELTSTSPPVLYVHLGDAEGSYNYGGTVKFLDMSWYARYKSQGDAIVSGFLWALFAWRMFIKLPGIISGVAGDIGQMQYSEPSWQRAAERQERAAERKEIPGVFASY